MVTLTRSQAAGGVAPTRSTPRSAVSTPVDPARPVESGEVVLLRQQLALLRAADGELLAYARATIAAARDGEPDPLSILAGLLEERGQLPRPDQRPAALLALGYREASA